MSAGSLYTDSISETEMGRRRTLDAHAAKGSGSVPAMATMEV